MLTLLNTDFLISLILTNGAVILTFLWLNHNYDEMLDRMESITFTSRHLDLKQKKILKQYFPFYRKLSPGLQRVFEQKLLFFFYAKKYEAAEGIELFDRMKLFISAYAAQVSLGFREYGFSYIDKVIVHPDRFSLQGAKKDLCWDLDAENNLHLSWKDFFDQLNKEVVLPMGLEIMAHAIKKSGNEMLMDRIFQSRFLLFHQISASENNASVRALFSEDDLKCRENFMEACLKNYLSYPLELKNSFPDLFRQLDLLLYSQIRLS